MFAGVEARDDRVDHARGAVELARAAEVAAAIAQPIDAAPFEMVLQGAGVFPPMGGPRVLWIGVTRGAREVVALQHTIAARVSALGIAIDDRASYHSSSLSGAPTPIP